MLQTTLSGSLQPVRVRLSPPLGGKSDTPEQLFRLWVVFWQLQPKSRVGWCVPSLSRTRAHAHWATGESRAAFHHC